MNRQGQTKQYEGSTMNSFWHFVLYVQQRDSPSLIFPGHTVSCVIQTQLALFVLYSTVFVVFCNWCDTISKVTETPMLGCKWKNQHFYC